MKLRFSNVDTSAMVNALQKLVGLRLANIYDLNQKTFLFKLAKLDTKELLLVESGIRMHTTQFQREKNQPSGFCMKLRKHLRTKRLTKITQLGTDRAVDFKFGENETSFHLIVEFYSSGNIILTDFEYKILQTLRVVHEESVMVGQTYDTSKARLFERMTRQKLMEALVPGEGMKKKDLTLKSLLKQRLAAVYGPDLIEYALYQSQVKSNWNTNELMDSGLFDMLLQAFEKADELFEKIQSTDLGGFIAYEDQDLMQYQDFYPLSLESVHPKQHLQFDSFDKCVDEYFSKLESQKFQLRAKQAEMQAQKKLENARQSHLNQVVGFELAQETKQLYAEAIEQHLWIVDSAIQTIRSFVASGMDWGDLKELVQEERQKGNPLAKSIGDLKLETGHIVLLLPNPRDDDSDDEPMDLLKIEVDIYASAFANARNYYDARKIATVKAEKTKQASKKALEQVEQKIKQELKQSVQQVQTITKIRKQYWFEKFIWFISSENYLVVGGRDAQQNEMLVKRYLGKGDVYVHAEIQGAASVIVKNFPKGQGAPDTTEEEPIPPSTLLQAGTMSVCYSRAWDAKVVTSAYWVHANQVSKQAPTGEYLTTGSFMVRGKKHFLPPIQLIYGIGLMFKVDEDSIVRHYWDRRPWGRDSEVPIEDIRKRLQAYEQGDLSEDPPTQDADALDATGEEDAPDATGEEVPDQTETRETDVVVQDLTDDPTFDFPDTTVDLKQEDQQADEADNPLDQQVPQDEQDEQDAHSQATMESDTSSLKQTKTKWENIRGKKGKLKKLKKYQEQDEEDRQLMMQLLKSNQGPKKKQQEKVVPKVNKKEREEIKKILKDENLELPDQSMNLSYLDLLTGQPVDQDTLLHCIPVCAPWSVLQKYTFKIKILPGSLKRGKA
ncbi:nuclear export mediator factor Nemf, partial [Gorgonomyces haynaldii]